MSLRLVLFVTAHPLACALQQTPFSLGIPSDIDDPLSGAWDLSHSEGPYLGFSGEVNIVCKAKPHASCGQKTLNHLTLNRTALDASNTLKSMRTACLGDSWDGHKCWSLMQKFRNVAYPRVRSWAGTRHPSMRTASMCTAPPVKHWQSGGGLRASVNCGAQGEQRNFFFRHNYKAAGFAIKVNLNRVAEEGGWRGDEDWWTEGRCQQYESLKKNWWYATLFTFVRDPISKFIDGYKEICTRNELKSFKHLLGNNVGTPDHARAFVDIVFHGTCDNPHVLSQAYILMNKACESKFDFIGKIENFDKDWAALSKHGGCTSSLTWSDGHEHKSQSSEYDKYEEVMLTALRANGATLFKALCWWMLPDFALFDYDLPPECASNEALRHALHEAKHG